MDIPTGTQYEEKNLIKLSTKDSILLDKKAKL